MERTISCSLARSPIARAQGAVPQSHGHAKVDGGEAMVDPVMGPQPSQPPDPDIPMVMAVMENGVPHRTCQPARYTRGKQGNARHARAEIPESEDRRGGDEPWHSQQGPVGVVVNVVRVAENAVGPVVEPAMVGQRYARLARRSVRIRHVSSKSRLPGYGRNRARKTSRSRHTGGVETPRTQALGRPVRPAARDARGSGESRRGRRS